MAGKGGGAWKVAYADFVTAMMAFFMVMWLTNQKPAVKESLGSYFRDPWAKTRFNSNETRTPTIRETKAGETNPDKPYRGSNPMLVPHDQPESVESKKPKIVTVRASDRTATGAVVEFDEGSYELNEAGKKSIQNVLPRLIGLNFKIEIRGHSNRREQYIAGDSAIDWDSCYKRSLAVLNYLRELGIEEVRLRLCQASGNEPLSVATDSKNIPKNVRVEIYLLNETVESLQGTPGERAQRSFPEEGESEHNDEHADEHGDGHGAKHGDDHASHGSKPGH